MKLISICSLTMTQSPKISEILNLTGVIFRVIMSLEKIEDEFKDIISSFLKAVSNYQESVMRIWIRTKTKKSRNYWTDFAKVILLTSFVVIFVCFIFFCIKHELLKSTSIDVPLEAYHDGATISKFCDGRRQKKTRKDVFSIIAAG